MAYDSDVDGLFLVRDNEFVSLAVDIDDFNLWVVLEMLAQFCDVDVHRTCVEIVVVNPDGLQSEVALQYFVSVAAEQCKQFVLLCCELCLLLADGEELLLCVEGEIADSVNRALLVLLAAHTAEDSLYTEHEFFH